MKRGKYGAILEENDVNGCFICSCLLSQKEHEYGIW